MMKISPTDKISKLGIRLRERRKRSQQDGHPAVTDDDERNISEFQKIVANSISLLERENVALHEGNIGLVAEYFEVKKNALKELELKQPLVEPFLAKQTPEIEVLKKSIRRLAETLRENGRLLQGMETASKAIMAEVERVRRKQGLEGLYDKTGQLRTDVTPSGRRIEKKL